MKTSNHKEREEGTKSTKQNNRSARSDTTQRSLRLDSATVSEDGKKKNLFIVGGPTASGKTYFAVNLAKKHNGELINVDSRQIYKYLPIGTNAGQVDFIENYKLQITNYIKNTKSEIRNLAYRQAGSKQIQNSKFKIQKNEIIVPLHSLESIPMHLLQFLEPDERFSVFECKELAEAVIQDIIERGKTPILVGGTGLYIDSILKNYELRDRNYEDLQNSRRIILESLTVEALQQELKSQNQELFTQLNESDRKNPRRLIRLIEKNSKFKALNPKQIQNPKLKIQNETRDSSLQSLASVFDVTFYYPEYNWEELKEKINQRVEEMFDEGLVEETKRVLEMGYTEDSVALQGIGYREVLDYLHGTISLEECKELVKIGHRQYARRQRTWFEGKGRGYELEIVNFKTRAIGSDGCERSLSFKAKI